ncbi:MAG: DUF4097 family beta strand repeat-containing protein [Solirubrobacteraceae bacterium]
MRSLRRLRGWPAAVVASAVVVAVALLALGVDWLATRHSGITAYAVTRPLTRIELRLSSGTARIVGDSSSIVQVRRADEFSFGHGASERRSLVDGVLRIFSRCPRIILGSCSASYELAVPESVAVNVQSTSGDVRLTGFRGGAAVQTRSGNVNVDAYCGFTLSAKSVSGNVRVTTACAPERLELRSGSGNATALVPPGRYQIRASSGTGGQRVSGVVSSPTAPFTIDVHSTSGNVAVEGGL